MSSMEIARLCNKRHDHVMRDIQLTLAQAGIPAPKFGGGYLDANNQMRPCYHLPRFEFYLVVSGYSVPYRAACLRRWHELEAKLVAAGGHYIPKSHADALIMAAGLAIKNECRPESMSPNLGHLQQAARQRPQGHPSHSGSSRYRRPQI